MTAFVDSDIAMLSLFFKTVINAETLNEYVLLEWDPPNLFQVDALFRTPPNNYDGVFLQKQPTGLFVNYYF